MHLLYLFHSQPTQIEFVGTSNIKDKYRMHSCKQLMGNIKGVRSPNVHLDSIKREQESAAALSQERKWEF
jgi:hypothetical protein